MNGGKETEGTPPYVQNKSQSQEKKTLENNFPFFCSFSPPTFFSKRAFLSLYRPPIFFIMSVFKETLHESGFEPWFFHSITYFSSIFYSIFFYFVVLWNSKTHIDWARESYRRGITPFFFFNLLFLLHFPLLLLIFLLLPFLLFSYIHQWSMGKEMARG